MFKREVRIISELIQRNLRVHGLETPLLQKRLIDSWPEVAGSVIAQHTTGLNIFNQTLFVRLDVPALRADLSMQRQDYVRKLNTYVGAQIISDIRFC